MNSLYNLIIRYLPFKKEDKDPMDWTLTKNSRPWHSEHFCPNCLLAVGHGEKMTDICNKCGVQHPDCVLLRSKRSVRKIIINGKWVIQRKYNDREDGYEII